MSNIIPGNKCAYNPSIKENVGVKMALGREVYDYIKRMFLLVILFQNNLHGLDPDNIIKTYLNSLI